MRKNEVGQQRERMRRIGVLIVLAADDPEAQARLATLLEGLQPLGWTVGSNLRIDTRWAAGSADNIRKQRPNWLHTRRTLSWPVVARLWNNYCVLCT